MKDAWPPGASWLLIERPVDSLAGFWLLTYFHTARVFDGRFALRDQFMSLALPVFNPNAGRLGTLLESLPVGQTFLSAKKNNEAGFHPPRASRSRV